MNRSPTLCICPKYTPAGRLDSELGDGPEAEQDFMYVALRDLRHAKGRFALIAAVVSMMMLLVGFVSGLAGGLAQQNISALLATGADRVVFSVENGKNSFGESSIDENELAAWQDAAGEDAVEPLGISTVRVEREGAAVSKSAEEIVDSLPISLFAASTGWRDVVPTTGEIAVGEHIASEMGVKEGSRVSVSGVDLRVSAVVPQEEHGHMPVAYVSLEQQHAIMDTMHQPHGVASVLLVTGDANADEAAGTTSESLVGSTLAIESFKAEIGSLGLMVAMLMGASILVVGVFFLVWSIQRQRDVAVLKALGAEDAWLRGDAVGQAAIILAVGIGIGVLLTIGLGFLAASGSAPFLLSWWTIGLPALGMFIAGLIGSMVSLRQITRADPLTALSAA